MEVQGGKQEKGFEFTGETGEYFRIWIVNVFLSIITLGIYSAWAKVRTNQYFYGNTYLDGSSFQYTASPGRILKGRLIAFAFFVVYNVLVEFSPALGGYFFLAGALLVPAIIVMAIAFRMRYTSWRGIKFGFERDFKTAYLLFSGPLVYFAVLMLAPLFLGITDETFQQPPAEGDSGEQAALTPAMQQYFWVMGLAMLAAGLLFPWWQKAYYVFVANRARFGNTRFSFSAGVGPFYAMYLVALLIVAVAFGLVGFGAASLVGLLGEAATWVILAIAFLPYAAAAAYIQTRRTNIVYGNLELSDLQFDSRLQVGRMIYLYSTNTLAILCSLGLAIPWAKIRVARYRAETMAVCGEDLAQFVAAQSTNQDSLGEEMGDMFDLEIGL